MFTISCDNEPKPDPVDVTIGDIKIGSTITTGTGTEDDPIVVQIIGDSASDTAEKIVVALSDIEKGEVSNATQKANLLTLLGEKDSSVKVTITQAISTVDNLKGYVETTTSASNVASITSSNKYYFAIKPVTGDTATTKYYNKFEYKGVGLEAYFVYKTGSLSLVGYYLDENDTPDREVVAEYTLTKVDSLQGLDYATYGYIAYQVLGTSKTRTYQNAKWSSWQTVDITVANDAMYLIKIEGDTFYGFGAGKDGNNYAILSMGNGTLDKPSDADIYTKVD